MTASWWRIDALGVLPGLDKIEAFEKIGEGSRPSRPYRPQFSSKIWKKNCNEVKYLISDSATANCVIEPSVEIREGRTDGHTPLDVDADKSVKKYTKNN